MTASILLLIPSLIAATVLKNYNNITSLVTSSVAVFFLGGAADFLIASSYVGTALSTATAMITINSVPIAIAGTFSIALVSAIALNKGELIHTSVAITVIVLLFGNYIAWRAMLGDQKFSWIHNLAVSLASIGGTTFQGADLTNANFTKATLNSTNFRGAILTRTRWYETQKLDLARVGDSILAKPSVRNLLVSGNGYKKSYIGENLKGANLAGVNLNEANLKEADLSEATLQDASLEGANLTKSQAIGTDFTQALFNWCLSGSMEY
ncbi:MAG: pentapeptide repeat-containing protein [Potamolinea sp.]